MLYKKDRDTTQEVHVDDTGYSYETSLQETRWIFFCTEVQQHITKVSRCDHVTFFLMSRPYQLLAIDCEYTFSAKPCEYLYFVKLMECSLFNSLRFIYSIQAYNQQQPCCTRITKRYEDIY